MGKEYPFLYHHEQRGGRLAESHNRVHDKARLDIDAIRNDSKVLRARNRLIGRAEFLETTARGLGLPDGAVAGHTIELYERANKYLPPDLQFKIRRRPMPWY